MPDSSSAKNPSTGPLDPTLASEIINAVATLVVVVDGEGKIVYVNPAVTTILGYQPEELLGDAWWKKVFGHDTEIAGQVRERVARAARGDTSALQGPHGRRLFAVSGEERWVIFTDAKGPGDLMIGVGQDITRLHAIEEL